VHPLLLDALDDVVLTVLVIELLAVVEPPGPEPPALEPPPEPPGVDVKA
jgi:hypothetical protein